MSIRLREDAGMSAFTQATWYPPQLGIPGQFQMWANVCSVEPEGGWEEVRRLVNEPQISGAAMGRPKRKLCPANGSKFPRPGGISRGSCD